MPVWNKQDGHQEGQVQSAAVRSKELQKDELRDAWPSSSAGMTLVYAEPLQIRRIMQL